MTLLPGLPRSAGTRKVEPIWILLKQELGQLLTTSTRKKVEIGQDLRELRLCIRCTVFLDHTVHLLSDRPYVSEKLEWEMCIRLQFSVAYEMLLRTFLPQRVFSLWTWRLFVSPIYAHIAHKSLSQNIVIKFNHIDWESRSDQLHHHPC